MSEQKLNFRLDQSGAPKVYDCNYCAKIGTPGYKILLIPNNNPTVNKGYDIQYEIDGVTKHEHQSNKGGGFKPSSNKLYPPKTSNNEAIQLMHDEKTELTKIYHKLLQRQNELKERELDLYEREVEARERYNEIQSALNAEVLEDRNNVTGTA